MIIYEPSLTKEHFMGLSNMTNLKEFKDKSDVIIANRYNEELNEVSDKVYTRYIYFRD